MATYSSHRLIMEKEEIDNFSVSLGIFGFFLQKCLLSSERQKGSIFVKMFKNLLLRNHKGDEAETWHTCLGH